MLLGGFVYTNRRSFVLSILASLSALPVVGKFVPRSVLQPRWVRASSAVRGTTSLAELEKYWGKGQVKLVELDLGIDDVLLSPYAYDRFVRKSQLSDSGEVYPKCNVCYTNDHISDDCPRSSLGSAVKVPIYSVKRHTVNVWDEHTALIAEGRSSVLLGEAICPYPPGDAKNRSWWIGRCLELEKMQEKP